MSKAILVLPEMPKSCKECVASKAECGFRADYWHCKVVDDFIAVDFVESELSRRPGFCPLREMPEKVYYGKDCSEWDDGYQSGVADVLRAIEGSGE